MTPSPSVKIGMPEVPDIEARPRELVEAGAQVQQEIRNVGGGRRRTPTATSSDSPRTSNAARSLERSARSGKAGSGVFFTILGWIVFGLIAGFIARAIVPGKDDIGLVRTIVLGIAGSVVGGFLFGLLTVGLRGFEPAGWIGSVVGAVIVLVAYNAITGRKRLRR